MRGIGSWTSRFFIYVYGPNRRVVKMNQTIAIWNVPLNSVYQPIFLKRNTTYAHVDKKLIFGGLKIPL